jgi:K+-transporting ATPase c subunit
MAFERLLGYVVALLVFGMVMAGVIFVIGVWVFHTAVRGSLPK